MTRMALRAACALLPVGMALAAIPVTPAVAAQGDGYAALVTLFNEWRAFERPVLRDGVADYGAAAMQARAAALPAWQARLAAIDPAGWPAAQRNDYKLVQAEMNGLDFDLRVLRPWARDPAFYVSVWPSRTDVPSREAPASQPETWLYDYKFPLSAADQRTLTARFAAIPALLAQARVNLKDSNARDLWVQGITMVRGQARALAKLQDGTLVVTTLEGEWPATLKGASPALVKAVAAARTATDDYIAWLEAEAPNKTGPSGIGKDNYSWYQQNVHFIPYSWDDEVALLRRELERAHAALRLEEYHNRNLPQLQPVADAAAFDKLSRDRLDTFVRFLVDQRIIPDKPYLKAALEPQLGGFVPEGKRAFFAQVTHREPMLLFSHDYHWIDLARMRDEPHASPIRKGALLANIWDNRAEGFATAFEELMMHAGLYDDNPRARELVWIMLANRAARGLASLYVQSNEWNLEQAGRFHSDWTPRRWAIAGDDLTSFEQLLYLRQPGYGTSYITGKLLFDRLVADEGRRVEREGTPFDLRDLLSRFNDTGMIPTILVDDELEAPKR
ncbi:DUF885 family protein [Sphingomonas sp.]|uniref:DUF885 family protein n=1 Tax=Sphingomonas sp. TaxID=28214 RepID=UPI002BAEA41D|nr:DUF885 family protein [Sphingomonas sp.]HWK36387.1 DUF885 family protein [Sphingomonas sp.]